MGNYRILPYHGHYIVVNENTQQVECHVDNYKEGVSEIAILLSEQ